MFADDLALAIHFDPRTPLKRQWGRVAMLQTQIDRVVDNANDRFIQFQEKKVKAMWLIRGRRKFPTRMWRSLKIYGSRIEMVKHYKYLGVIFDRGLTFRYDVEKKVKQGRQRIGIVSRIREMGKSALRLVYRGFVECVLMYGILAYYEYLSRTNKEKLEAVQVAGGRMITGCLKSTPRASVL
jgi:hypothetical protein